MRLWLVRHGETQHNLDGIFQGQLDTPLTERGVQQARLTAEALTHIPFARICSSDLMRAFDTAEPIAEGRSIEVEPDERLRELHYGVLQGVAYADFRDVLRSHGVEREWGPGVFSERGIAPPDGESLDDLIARIRLFLSEIEDQSAEGGDVAVVTHGGTIRSFMTEILGLPAEERGKFALSNCGVTCFARADDHWTLEFHNRVFWPDGLQHPAETV
ncbi:MAG: histidine phosphatase family protein [Thermomicrobiales bacterium]